MPDWTAARASVPLDPTVCMLNTGSYGPTPTPVFDRVTELRRRLAAGPTDFFTRQMPPLLWDARVRTAQFLGTTPERLVFTGNVSMAINLVASGLRLNVPGEILLTDHEYGAMQWCWERAAQRQGLTIRTYPLPTMAKDPSEIIGAAVKAMTAKTRLFFFSHVLSPTGLVLPAQELCAEARKRGILTVVDGAHAPGMLPLNVDAVRADFYTANLHKWLLAPIGAGFLAIGNGNEDRLQPLQVSWGYHPDRNFKLNDDRDPYGSTWRTRFLEFEGTKDVCPWLAIPAAIDFQASLGWDAIRARMAELSAFSRAKLVPLGLTPATPDVPGMHGALTAFELPKGLDAAKLREDLWKRRIEIPIIERPDRTLIRVSGHFYTTEAEIEQLTAALPSLLSA